LRKEIEWGFNDIYGISGNLNQHPRAAMKQRANEKDRDNCFDFYVECTRLEDGDIA
jgi:4-hydroxy 2-oxovalerate aldolase